MLINRVNIVGNLTKDPEIKKTPSGKQVSNFSIIHTHSYFKNKEKVTKVSYFDVEYWGQSLDRPNEHMLKGSAVAVEGRLIQDRWQMNGKPQSRVKIVADIIQYLHKRKENGESQDPTPIGEIIDNVCEGMSNEIHLEE